jgi:hypothetical protein
VDECPDVSVKSPRFADLDASNCTSSGMLMSH